MSAARPPEGARTVGRQAEGSSPVNAVPLRAPASIRDWHAHVYFDADSRDAAWALRERIEVELAGRMVMGRFHERPVGPHPMWSYQLGIAAPDFAHVLGWLVLNHGALDVFVHPNTGDALADHRDCALWIGHSHVLQLSGFGS